VGCQAGILIWIVDPSSVAARPSASAVNLLETAGHKPVTSLQWDPNVKNNIFIIITVYCTFQTVCDWHRRA